MCLYLSVTIWALTYTSRSHIFLLFFKLFFSSFVSLRVLAHIECTLDELAEEVCLRKYTCRLHRNDTRNRFRESQTNE